MNSASLSVVRDGYGLNPISESQAHNFFRSSLVYLSLHEAVSRRNPQRRELAKVLTMMGRPTVDKTGDTGEYDFTLSWDENAGPTLSTALKEQLGLQVESLQELGSSPRAVTHQVLDALDRELPRG
jgi:uncharacterized protein (TIGR03435 family)